MNRARVAITELLEAVERGEEHAFDELYALVYSELRRLAHVVRQGRAGETLNTTALVHEAYLKLANGPAPSWADRAHFFRVAARAMRQVLVDAARGSLAKKRGGGALTVAFDEQLDAPVVQPEELLAIDEALDRLETFDARKAKVIEYRFFAGLSVEETAAVLDCSVPTVKRDWRAARAWLAHELAW